eukprot:Clim_evm62s144 gene=Clim_evmTU62s144
MVQGAHSVMASLFEDGGKMAQHKALVRMGLVGKCNIALGELSVENFKNEEDLKPMMDLIFEDLSEAYTVYTYRFFIVNWPQYTWIARYKGKIIGCVLTNLFEDDGIKQGYIAMLAVTKSYRRNGVGTALVKCVLDQLIADGADEIGLETEVINSPAIRLYESLGFSKDKRLIAHYQDGSDAFRMKLWLTEPQ